MKKYIIPIILGISIFGTLYYYLDKKQIEVTEIVLELNAIIPENDIFYVYYLQEGIESWSDKHSVYQRINGSGKSQKLQFVLPLNKPLSSIRLDIGANKSQGPMAINSLVFSSKTGKLVLNENIFDYLEANQYLKYKDSLFIPNIISERYDPFLTAKPDLSAALKTMGSSRSKYTMSVKILISIIFTMAFLGLIIGLRLLLLMLLKSPFRKKYVGGVVISSISFVALYHYLGESYVVPTGIEIEMEVEVYENDIFYVYYLQQGIKSWSDNQSVYQRIKGSGKNQKLQFIIPVDKPIGGLRLDIGANKSQSPIRINSVSFGSETGKLVLRENILEYFEVNNYLKSKDGLFLPNIVAGRYDPFLISNPAMSKVLTKLVSPKPRFNLYLKIFISLIFSAAILVFFINLNLLPNQFDIVITSFSIVLLLPTLSIIFGFTSNDDNLEKREMAKMPNFESFISFPNEFEKYYNDNFGLRNYMIEFSSKIKINLFNTSPKPELVQFGDEKFLFYNSFEDEIFKSYTRTNLISEKDLYLLYKKLNSRSIDLSSKNIKYLFGFWPNKHTIYPENLPSSMSMQISDSISLADQITYYFTKKGLLFFDVRDGLLTSKNNGNLYRKLDSHWNALGAYRAYVDFCKDTYSIIGLTPHSQNEFDIGAKESSEGDLVKMLGVKSIFGFKDILPVFTLKDKSKGFEISYGTDHLNGTIITKSKMKGNAQKVLIFRDSFSSALIQFISLHFEEVIYTSSTYDEALIDLVKPDIVISCRTERYILSL
jgi:hypothetical protein